jgi:hypothetical protein
VLVKVRAPANMLRTWFSSKGGVAKIYRPL